MKAQTVPDSCGLVPAIHALATKKGVDARHKATAVRQDSCIVILNDHSSSRTRRDDPVSRRMLADRIELQTFDSSCRFGSDGKESNRINKRNKITMQFPCRTAVAQGRA
jgi:hypothetical protein